MTNYQRISMKTENSIREPLGMYKESIYYWVVFSSLSYKEKHQKKTVVFYPALPNRRHILGRIFRILRYHITTDLQAASKASFIVNWEDTTFRQQIPALLDLSATRPIINIGCRDISKKYVDAMFKKVFGYQTMIDPTTHRGKCVKKGDLNAVHDGSVVDCPVVNPEAGFIYQKLINNQEGMLVEDIRVPIFRDDIPFVYVKNRSVQGRFKSKNTKCVITRTEQVFSKTEVDNIIEFCNLVGLDYGELDVLRDRDDGKIYIVDVNNTPGGPPNSMSRLNELRALRKLTVAFVENFLKRTSSRPIEMAVLQK